MNSWLGKGSNGAGKLTWINSWQYKGSRSWGRWISADQQLTVKVAMKQVSAPGWTTDSGDSSCFTCHQLPLCFVLPRRSCLSKFFVTSRRKIRKCETVEDDSYFFLLSLCSFPAYRPPSVCWHAGQLRPILGQCLQSPLLRMGRWQLPCLLRTLLWVVLLLLVSST